MLDRSSAFTNDDCEPNIGQEEQLAQRRSAFCDCTRIALHKSNDRYHTQAMTEKSTLS